MAANNKEIAILSRSILEILIDILSKRLFSFLMFIFTLVETGTKEQPPIITIPAG